MRINLQAWTRLLAALCVAVISLSAHAEDLKPEDIVSRHLDSIAPADVRAALKSRVVQGSLKFHILVGGGGDVSGTWGRVSEQNHSNFVMRFAAGVTGVANNSYLTESGPDSPPPLPLIPVRCSHSLSAAR